MSSASNGLGRFILLIGLAIAIRGAVREQAKDKVKPQFHAEVHAGGIVSDLESSSIAYATHHQHVPGYVESIFTPTNATYNAESQLYSSHRELSQSFVEKVAHAAAPYQRTAHAAAHHQGTEIVATRKRHTPLNLHEHLIVFFKKKTAPWIVAFLFALSVMAGSFCLCWCVLVSRVLGSQMSERQAPRWAPTPTTATEPESEPDFFYVTYLEVDSTDSIGTWNPSTVTAKDGVQLAIVKDGKVERLPTQGKCSHSTSIASGQKEWYNILVPAYCVNNAFSELPTVVDALYYKAECGTKRLPVGVPAWGGNILVVGEVYSKIYKTKTPRRGQRTSKSAEARQET